MTSQIPERDCGRSLEELSEYLQTGTSPDRDHIEHCPQCQAGLAALQRLDVLTGDFIEDDIRRADAGEEPWFRSIMDNLRLETKAGRSIPVSSGAAGDDLSETEGAVIALLRTAGDAVPGAMIGRCRLNGDLSTPDAPVEVAVNVSAVLGRPVHAAAADLRRALADALAVHTELNVVAINIAVTDLTMDETVLTEGGR